MNKVIISFAILVLVFAFAEANIRQCHRVCRKGQPSLIRCVKDKTGCHKMKTCHIEEENCRRRMINRELLKHTPSYRCRYIAGPLGSGRCALWKRNCHNMRCNNPSKKLKCYRSRNKQCQLLTACQLRHVNCQRGRKNALMLTNSRYCHGLKSGQPLKPCRILSPYF